MNVCHICGPQSCGSLLNSRLGFWKSTITQVLTFFLITPRFSGTKKNLAKKMCAKLTGSLNQGW